MGRAHKLTALQAGRLTTPGLYGDGAGLWLKVGEGGARSWLFRCTIDGRERWMGLGPARDVTLAEARDAARELRRQILAGIDPIAHRREQRASRRADSAKAVTFDWCAAQYIAAHRAGWKNPKHGDQWANTLAAYASPIFGALDVSRIETGHVMRALEPIWSAKPETASRVRSRIELVLGWATARGYRSGDNPARWRGHLDALLPKTAKVARVQHFPALPWPEVPAFMLALRAADGVAARALELAILTAARSGEVRGAAWSEFDLQAGVWTIPADRMKAASEHRVPLSPAALALLAMMEGHDHALVFPGTKKGDEGSRSPLSDMALTAVIRRLHEASVRDEGPGFTDPKSGGRVVTAHGFRSAFRDWAADHGYPRDLAEAALAHVVAGVEGAYRRTDMLERRREMLTAWAQHCGGSA